MTESYHVRLANFDGPLELLLHLVHKAKIELTEIFVSEITDQYLKLMDSISEIDMERASDFLNMAARLLYIKSRALLPVKNDPDDEDFIDPETELLNDLRAKEEYLRIRELSQNLHDMENEACDIFYKLPEELLDDREYILLDADKKALYKAYVNLLSKTAKEKDREYTVEVRRDSFSIRKQKSKILGVLKSRGKASFFMFFNNDPPPMEVAVTFSAMLELWHARTLYLEQAKHFEDIKLSLLPLNAKKMYDSYNNRGL